MWLNSLTKAIELVSHRISKWESLDLNPWIQILNFAPNHRTFLSDCIIVGLTKELVLAKLII